MGYTHYFELNSKPTAFQIASFNALVEKLIAASTVTICDGVGTSSPVITKQLICINGSTAKCEDYETFCIDYENPEWSCCKTAHNPYDEVVVGILMLAESLLDLEWSSDGDESFGDFNEAKELLKKVI